MSVVENMSAEDRRGNVRLIRRIQEGCTCGEPGCKRIQILLAEIDKLEAVAEAAQPHAESFGGGALERALAEWQGNGKESAPDR